MLGNTCVKLIRCLWWARYVSKCIQLYPTVFLILLLKRSHRWKLSFHPKYQISTGLKFFLSLLYSWCIQVYSYSTEDLSVAEGNSAKFICSATGHPQPQIIWQKVPKSSREKARIRLVDKNGKEIVQKRIHGQVLELPKVSRRDMGTYLCIAKNNVPPAVSKNFKLTVNCKIQIKMYSVLLKICICSWTANWGTKSGGGRARGYRHCIEMCDTSLT